MSLLAAVGGLQAPVSQDMALVVNQRNNPGVSGSIFSLPIDISSLRDNRAFAMTPNDTDFDAMGSGVPPSRKLHIRWREFYFPAVPG